MTNDIFLVVGVVVLVLAIPSVVSSLSDRRAPRAAAIMVLIGGGLVALAIMNNPAGYTIDDVPRAFSRVINRLIH